MNLTHVKGVDKVVKNLKKQNSNMGNTFAVRLKRAGLYLQRQSQKIVPVDTGNLKASAFTRSRGTGWNTSCWVGYTAAYAIHVHENLDLRHGKEYNDYYADEIADKNNKTFRKRGENQQAKFLEQPARQYRKHILKIIAGKV